MLLLIPQVVRNKVRYDHTAEPQADALWWFIDAYPTGRYKV